MKKTISAIFILISLSAFSQNADSLLRARNSPQQVFIREYYDTVKVLIVYDDKSYLRIIQGFQVRHLVSNSAAQGTEFLGNILYDDKWKLFKKRAVFVNQIQ